MYHNIIKFMIYKLDYDEEHENEEDYNMRQEALYHLSKASKCGKSIDAKFRTAMLSLHHSVETIERFVNSGNSHDDLFSNDVNIYIYIYI